MYTSSHQASHVEILHRGNPLEAASRSHKEPSLTQMALMIQKSQKMKNRASLEGSLGGGSLVCRLRVWLWRAFENRSWLTTKRLDSTILSE